MHALFLDPEHLQRLFAYMCRSSTRDPIADTARIMLTTPVQFHISRHGVGLFKGCPVFPFTYMGGEQRQWLFELLSAMGGDQMHSALQAIDAPLEYTAENDRIFFKTAPDDASLAAYYHHPPTQAPRSSPPHLLLLLDPRRVFDALLGAVADSGTAYPDRLRLLVNLLLQRIGCQVQIGRELLAHIQGEMDRRLGPSTA